MPGTSHSTGVVRAALVAACVVVCASAASAPPAPAGATIVNIATSRYLPVSDGEPVSVDSNPVVTTVLGGCVAQPLLSVEPAGTVAPGAVLRYRVEIENPNPFSAQDVAVGLPLDPALGSPLSFSDGQVGGARTVEAIGAYDEVAHRVDWSMPLIEPGEVAVLEVSVAVRDDLSGPTVITLRAESSAAACADVGVSGSVTVTAVPPILTLTLRADRRSATVGDVVVLSAEIGHVAPQPPIASATLRVRLPVGLRLARESLRIDGVPGPDPPIGSDGRVVDVSLTDIEPLSTRWVSLAAVVTAEAVRGEAIASARIDAAARGSAAIGAGPSSAAIEVVPGPFRREATLLGRVFVDDDGDGIPGPGEPGVPGVLVLLEDGRGAITDVTGRYSVEDVRPGLHSIRLDPDTLPPTLTPRAAGFEWAGSSHGRFIEARAATLAVADMPVGPPRAPRCVVVGGGERVTLPTAVLDGPESTADGILDAAARRLLEGPAALRAVGVECAGHGRDDATREAELAEALDRRIAAGRAVAPADDSTPTPAGPPAADFDAVLRSAPVEPTILSPAEGALAARGRVDVDVLYPADTVPRLTVNGRPVSRDRIGTESTLPSRGATAARYVGVELEEGVNVVELRTGPGRESGVAVRVVRPGRPVALRVEAPHGHWVADGVTPAELSVEAVDGAGVRSDYRGRVTVTLGDAEPLAGDLDPDEPGAQLKLVDGHATVTWPPRTVPGRVRVIATADDLELDRFVDVRPAAGRWRVHGLAEMRAVGDGGVEGDGGLPPGVGDDVTDSGGRVAVFARGPVGDASRLTVSLDTDRERDRDRLTRAFEPALFAPVVGDESVPTDEAAAQGTLFARLDGPRGFVQWGDMDTGFERTELSRYDRRLEGAIGRVGNGRVSFDAFAAEADQQVARDVFAADGTSGPFLLRASPVVARSERVVVEVRDRDRPDRVLSRRFPRADVDYDLDPVAGTLLFRSPVAAFDDALNPVRVVVVYETRGGGEDRWSTGARLAVAAGEMLEVGAGGVVESRAGEDLALYGVDMTWRPRPGTEVAAEVARSDAAAAETALRLDVRSRLGGRFGWELSFRDLPEGFDNPTLLSAPELGTRRVGASFDWQPGDTWQIRGEALADEDDASGRERRSMTVDARKRVGPVTVLGGVRQAESDDPVAGDRSSTAARVGASGRIGERWTADALHEQALDDDPAIGFPTRTSAGVSFRVVGDLRLVARQELESGDGVDRDRTTVGIEGRVSDTTRAEVGWRLEDGADGSAVRSLAGVETVLPVGERDAIRVSAARLQTSNGSGELDFTTLAGAWEHRAGRRLVSARYELRLSPQGDRHLVTASGAWRPASDWTLFVRERVFADEAAGGGDAWRAEGLFGAALRPTARPWRLLVRADHSTGRGTAFGPGGVTAGGAPSQPSGSFEDPVPVTAPPGLGTGPGRALSDRGDGSLSVAFGARVNARQRIAASAILRRAQGDADLGVPSTFASLVSFHLTTELGTRWQLGASVRRLGERESRTESYGMGVELSRLVLRNVWLTAGFNAVGLDDERFPTNDRLDAGPFLALRIAFDESSLTSLSDLRLDRD